MSAELAEAKAVIVDIVGTAREQEQGLREMGKLAATLEHEARDSTGLCQQAASAGTDLAEDAAAQLRLVRRFRIARPLAVAALPKRRPIAVVRPAETPLPRPPEAKRSVPPFRVIDGGLAERGAAHRKTLDGPTG